MNATHRRLGRVLRGGDAGVTLAELVVSMAVMSVVMTLFTAGVIQMYRAANKAELVAGTQSQLTIAFLRLDRELRYAEGIATPHVSDGNRYVEYLKNESATLTCVQLQLNAQDRTLRRQAWPQGQARGTTWQTLATDVNVVNSTFVRPDDADVRYQQLRLTLEVGSGTGNRATTATSEVTFTALNSSVAVEDETICPEARTT